MNWKNKQKVVLANRAFLEESEEKAGRDTQECNSITEVRNKDSHPGTSKVLITNEKYQELLHDCVSLVTNHPGILKELENSKLYREFNVDYAIFSQDTQNKKEINFEISNIINSAKIFFKKKSYDLNWDELNILDSDQQINTIIMISPFSIEEKQILLETIHIKDKLDILKKIFQFYLLELIEPKSLQ